MELDDDDERFTLAWKVEKLEKVEINTNWDTNFTSDGLLRVETDIDLFFSFRTSFLSGEQGTSVEDSIHLDHKNVFSSEETYKMIRRPVSDWPISDDLIDKLAAEVYCAVEDMIDKTIPGHFRLKIAEYCTFPETIPLNNTSNCARDFLMCSIKNPPVLHS